MRTSTSRERWLLGGVGTLLTAVLLWSYVWHPAFTQKRASLDRLAKIDALQGVLQSLPSTNAPLEPIAQTALRERVTQTAARLGLTLQRLDPQGNALSVVLSSTSFAKLMGWIDTMTSQAQIRVVAVEIGRLPEPGRVTARLVLEDLR